jgi:hypothetical protein
MEWINKLFENEKKEKKRKKIEEEPIFLCGKTLLFMREVILNF